MIEGLLLETREDKFPLEPRPCWRWLITETDDVDELLKLLNPQRRGGGGGGSDAAGGVEGGESERDGEGENYIQKGDSGETLV